MDFYSRQAAARRHSRWLLLAFVAAVALVVAAVDVVLFTLLASTEHGYPVLAPLEFAAQRPGVAAVCSLAVLSVVGLASLYKSLQLRGGGGVVARALGGVRVGRDTADPVRKRLHNVVEEMAIASGVPMPEVYVLEQEQAINAFAAGHTPADAAIAVTQGALTRLRRDELQGVVAHEFSHILNGDMRLNVQLMGWLFGLFVVALTGRTILRGASRARSAGRGAPALLLVALAIMLLGYVGLFAGRILQAAVSRQRERLADASAVQFTRNPHGLKGALVKIAASGAGSRLAAAGAEQVAHMLFAPGLSRWFATHPPILERIRSLDPRFDTKEIVRAAIESACEVEAVEERAEVAQLDAASAASAAATQVPAQSIAALVGHPQIVHVRHARALRLALPEELREFVESTGRARALVLALLLSRDAAPRARQAELIREALGPAALAAIEEAAVNARHLAPMLRLPALQQLFPALRRLPLEERRALADLAARLAAADGRVEVFEFCLAKLLQTLLRDELETRPAHGTASLADAEEPIHVLFAVLARAGAADDVAARRAYEAGMHVVLPRHRPAYAPIADWPRRLGAALERLERLHPFAKKAVIEGLAKTVAHDELLSVAEAELLRTVCALLHCPLPPLLAGPAQAVPSARAGARETA